MTPEELHAELRAEILNNPVLWRKLKLYLEARLNSHRISNDARMDEAKRNILIGKIATTKLLLTLDSPVPVVEKADDPV